MPTPNIITPKISPFLWFNMNAEEAVAFYTSLFPDSQVFSKTHYGEGAPVPPGTVMTIAFQLAGQRFTALNGGPMYKFTEAVSFVAACDDQAEIDRYWDALTSNGGHAVQCGWCKDRFGLSWQIVPAILPQLISGPNTPKVMAALFQMAKLDIAALQAAAK